MDTTNNDYPNTSITFMKQTSKAFTTRVFTKNPYQIIIIKKHAPRIFNKIH